MKSGHNKHSDKSRAHIPESYIPDELNKDLIFHTTHTDLLVKALSGDINIMECLKEELSARGLNKKGEWVGFNNSQIKN